MGADAFDTGTGSEGTPGGGNWDELLGSIPEEYHEKVTPYLSTWDQNYQRSIEKVHSEYEPWKPIIKSGYEVKDVEFGLNLLNALNDNPQLVYDNLGQYYGFNKVTDSGQGQGDSPNNQEESDPYRRELDELKSQHQMMVDVMKASREQELVAKAEQQLDSEFKSLSGKYGEFDEAYVLAKMEFQRMSAEDAVKNYHSWREQQVKNFSPKPLLLGGGGGIPGQQVDVRKLDEKGRKQYVQSLLEAAARDRND